jgi:hypothetical protein
LARRASQVAYAFLVENGPVTIEKSGSEVMESASRALPSVNPAGTSPSNQASQQPSMEYVNNGWLLATTKARPASGPATKAASPDLLT